MEPKLNVLFLCTHNSCRSQMAEALLRKYGGDRFNVYSAGLDPTEIDPMAREVMREIGLDMEGQHAKGVRTYLGKRLIHHLIIVCEAADAECPRTWPGLQERHFWPVKDPAVAPGDHDERLRIFRQVRDRLEQRIKVWLEEAGEPVRLNSHHEPARRRS